MLVNVCLLFGVNTPNSLEPNSQLNTKNSTLKTPLLLFCFQIYIALEYFEGGQVVATGF